MYPIFTPSEALTILLVIILIGRIEFLIRIHGRENEASEFIFYAGKRERIFNMLMNDSQKVDLSIEVVNAKGNPASLDGTPVWENSAPEVAELTVAADGLSASLVAKTTGAGSLSVKGDAKLGEEVKEIMGSFDFEVVAGEATIISIKASEPVDQ